MPRRVFLSYPSDFPRREELGPMSRFLAGHGAIVTIPPGGSGLDYPAMEEAIEHCDAFIAVIGPPLRGCSQTHFYLDYARELLNLRRRWLPRPRIFGLWIGPSEELPWLEGYPIEPLTTETLGLLLVDLPRKDSPGAP